MDGLITRPKYKVPDRSLLFFENEIQNSKSMDNKLNIFKSNDTYKGKNLIEYSIKLLSDIASQNEIFQASFFVPEYRNNTRRLRFLTSLAIPDIETNYSILEAGYNYPRKVADSGRLMNICDQTRNYSSRSGSISPVSLLVFPVKNDDEVLAVISLASFHRFDINDELYFEEIAGLIAKRIIKCIAKS